MALPTVTLLEFLRDLANFQDYSRQSRILLIAYYLRQYRGLVEFSANDIKKCCMNTIKPPSQLSAQLKIMSKGKDSPLTEGTKTGFYSLAMPGLDEVESYLSGRGPSNADVDALLQKVIPHLQSVIAQLTQRDQKKFMQEALECLAIDARRGALLMVWAATLDHLFDYVLQHKLVDFNQALHRRQDRHAKLTVQTRDDFSDIKESVFIEVCRSAKIISNDVRKILDQKLDIRNTYAHPSNVTIGTSKVVDFVEDLTDNVLIKYVI